MRKRWPYLSLALNVMFIATCAVWVAKKGGPRYILEQLGVVQGKAPIRPFQEDAIAEFRLWPNGQDEIVFAGDSITRSVPWEELLTPVRNRGLGGETSDGLLRRWDEIIESRPRQVVVNVGTNDLSRNFQVADIVANFRQIIDISRRESPATELVIVSVLPIHLGFGNDDALHRGKLAALPALNDQLRALATETGHQYLDLWPAFVDPETGQIKLDLTRDGLHLNAKGKLLYAECVRPWVKVAR